MGKHTSKFSGTSVSPPKNCKCLNRVDGLFFTLLAMKLAGAIGWPWWLVFSPIWLPVLVNATIFVGKVGYEMAKQNGGVK